MKTGLHFRDARSFTKATIIHMSGNRCGVRMILSWRVHIAILKR